MYQGAPSAAGTLAMLLTALLLPSVTYLDYIIFFQKLDRVQGFSAGATRLYLKLLDVVNGIADGGPWPAEFAKSDPYMRGVSGASLNPFKDYREELEQRGLITTVPGGLGRNSVTTYRLLGNKKVSESDTLTGDKLSESDTLTSKNLSESDTLSGLNLSESDTQSPKTGLNLSGKVSDSDNPYLEREKESVDAAAAAPPTSSLSAERPPPPPVTSSPKPASKKPKKGGTTPADIAALVLPHPGPDFAATWRTFYTQNTKQAGKPLSAFELMLKKLGKYPEGFAVEMLEAAIQGNWSGVENGGTAQRFTEWRAQQAQRPTPPPATVQRPAADLNHQLIAEQQAAEAAALQARLNHYATTS